MEITWALLDDISSMALEAFVNGFIQSTVLLACVLLSVCLLKDRLSAAMRYLIWYLLLIVIVGLPFLLIGLSKSGQGSVRSLGQESADESSGTVSQTIGSIDRELSDTRTLLDNGEQHTRMGTNATQYLVTLSLPKSVGGSWLAAFFGIWILVSLWKLSRILLSYISLQRIRKNSTPLAARYQTLLKRHAEDLSIRKSVQLGSSHDIAAPVVAGFRNVVVLIPEKLMARISVSEFEQVILHELADIRRGDNWTKLGQMLVHALFFFHPMVWWLGSRLDIEREVACDNWVISRTGHRRDYAICLTTLMESLNGFETLSLAPEMFSTHPQVFQRIKLLLDRKRNVTPGLSPVGACAVLLLMAGAILYFSLALPAVGIAASKDDTASARQLMALDGDAYLLATFLPNDLVTRGAASTGLMQNLEASDVKATDARHSSSDDPINLMQNSRIADPAASATPPPNEEPQDKAVQKPLPVNPAPPSTQTYDQQLVRLMSRKLDELQRKYFSDPEFLEMIREAAWLDQPNRIYSPEYAAERENLKSRMREFQKKVSAKLNPQVRELEAQTRLTLAKNNEDKRAIQ